MTRFVAPIRNPDITSKEWQQFFAKLKITEADFTPAFTNLTLGGGGSVAYSGRYFRFGSRVWFTAYIDVSGGRTTSSTPTSTYFNPPLVIAWDNICAAANVTTGASFGNGTIEKATNRIYTPLWTGAGGDIVISGWYETTF